MSEVKCNCSSGDSSLGWLVVLLLFLFWGEPDLYDFIRANLCEGQSTYSCEVEE